ncbi:hypothetical protein JI735_34400 (plasmid) [Paenibacillus sonchi]|uniref:Uncharacterized protein n=1 Tax=Paenibacillus sonchi TaxID=373687 RepID=A0A974PIC7_9BACL|nr:hypothetical protein [Paenibacillus sonchi]QQZ64529.1 hypothetical protein JI735_34400 [Paenibacillus sonchi]
MGHKGHFGVSMGTIIKRPKKIDPGSKHCSNCKHYQKGMCRIIAKISNGRQTYVNDKTAAHLCAHFILRQEKITTDNEAQKKKKPGQKLKPKKYRYLCDSHNRHVVFFKSKVTIESRCTICKDKYDMDVKLKYAPLKEDR